MARVNEVKRESGQPFARVTATPLAQLDSGHEALLVWTLPEEGPTPDLAEERGPDRISDQAKAQVKDQDKDHARERAGEGSRP